MKKVYKFYWDCGRMGSLSGAFIADAAVIEDAIGANVYFGEVLGKHSEIYGKLKRENFTEICDNQAFIAQLETYKLLPTGYSPLDYLEDDEEEEDEI